MRIPAWRLALTGAALVILVVGAIGVAAAAGLGGGPATAPVAAAPTAAPDASGQPSRPGIGARFEGLRPLRFARHLVHADVTVTDKDGNLVHLQLDHGTISAIGNGSLTIAEAGGGSFTISTDADTKVRVGREPGSLSDLKVGDEIFAQSRIDGTTVLAKHIVEAPASTD
jgi:hypothetical protein